MKVIIHGTCDLHRALIKLAQWGREATEGLNQRRELPMQAVESLLKLYQDPEDSKILLQVAKCQNDDALSLVGNCEEELCTGEVLISNEFFGVVVSQEEISRALRVFK